MKCWFGIYLVSDISLVIFGMDNVFLKMILLLKLDGNKVFGMFWFFINLVCKMVFVVLKLFWNFCCLVGLENRFCFGMFLVIVFVSWLILFLRVLWLIDVVFSMCLIIVRFGG